MAAAPRSSSADLLVAMPLLLPSNGAATVATAFAARLEALQRQPAPCVPSISAAVGPKPQLLVVVVVDAEADGRDGTEEELRQR